MENRPVYSADIAEIIGTPPRWIMRSGGGLLLLLLLAFAGLAARVSIPEQNSLPVRVSGLTQPHYLLQRPGGAQLLVAAGQRVQLGQPLGSAADERAPFAGTVFYAAPTGVVRSVGDTLGLVVPLINTYRFSGQLVVEQLPELHAHAEALQVQVPLPGQADGQLLLRGRLSYLDPVVRGGTVRYNGQLDSSSSAAVAQHFAAITSLEGTLLLRQRPQPILQRLLHY